MSIVEKWTGKLTTDNLQEFGRDVVELEKRCRRFETALRSIRDSTFQSAYLLRAKADRVLQEQ